MDAGLNCKQVTGLLDRVDVLPETLSGILITHEHIDHIRGVGVLARKYHIPVYANQDTWDAMERTVGEVPMGLRRVFTNDGDFYIGDLAVTPFSIPHDAADPVAFRLHYGRRSVAVVTDLGYIPKEVYKRLDGTDMMIFESNYDPDMLMQNTKYPESLKSRIRGRKGHLSNEGSAQALVKLAEAGVKGVLLGHLSEHNNTPELALHTVCQMLEQEGIRAGKDLFVQVACRSVFGERYVLE